MQTKAITKLERELAAARCVARVAAGEDIGRKATEDVARLLVSIAKLKAK